MGMSQYKFSPGQLNHLKRKYAEDAEAEKDIRTWDTPYDEPMSIREAQQRVKGMRDAENAKEREQGF